MGYCSYAQELQWFDRAHSVFLDWLVASGVIGLIAYLSLYVFILLGIKNSNLTIGKKAVLVGLLAGYFVHNIFVFDNLASYVMFFALLAFANSLNNEKEKIFLGHKNYDKDAIEYVALPIVVVVLLGSLYFVQYRLMSANKTLLNALIYCSNGRPTASIFESALAINSTTANQEIREQLLNCSSRVIPSNQIPIEIRQQFLTLTSDEIAKQLSYAPKDARMYVLGGEGHVYLTATTQDTAGNESNVRTFNTVMTTTSSTEMLASLQSFIAFLDSPTRIPSTTVSISYCSISWKNKPSGVYPAEDITFYINIYAVEPITTKTGGETSSYNSAGLPTTSYVKVINVGSSIPNYTFTTRNQYKVAEKPISTPTFSEIVFNLTYYDLIEPRTGGGTRVIASYPVSRANRIKFDNLYPDYSGRPAAISSNPDEFWSLVDAKGNTVISRMPVNFLTGEFGGYFTQLLDASANGPAIIPGYYIAGEYHPPVDFTFTLPGSTFNMQQGSINPLYSTFQGSLVFDTFLKKWGCFKHPHKLIVGMAPVNGEVDGTVSYYNFGVDSGILTEDGQLVVFDSEPDEGYIGYGRIGYYRLGFNQNLEIRFGFRSPFTGSIRVQGSLDGHNLDPTTDQTQDCLEVVDTIVYCNSRARWYIVKISGNYDLQYMEFRANISGRR
jgi:hypothetical protein